MDADTELRTRAASLATHLRDLADRASRRTVIGLVGAPGAGKSTLAAMLADTLGPDLCVVVPMDGFHLATSIIAGTARASRRGAIDTFDSWGYVNLMRRIVAQNGHPIYAPTFRRGLEEPIAAAIEILDHVPIVITEGNYLLVDDDPWRDLRDILTETWFIETDEDKRIERLVERHVLFGKTMPEARAWALGPDLVNADFIRTTRARAVRVIDW